MQAEFIVVSGPLLGERFPLGPGETRIGRAPTADIRLTEAGTAWEHCIVRERDGRYHIVDRRTGAGTFVNGMRIDEHRLEPDDQVGICDTVLVYREDAPCSSEACGRCAGLSAYRLRGRAGCGRLAATASIGA